MQLCFFGREIFRIISISEREAEEGKRGNMARVARITTTENYVPKLRRDGIAVSSSLNLKSGNKMSIFYGALFTNRTTFEPVDVVTFDHLCLKMRVKRTTS